MTGVQTCALPICRRLVQWAQALPPDRLLAPEETYAALTATFGPLADAHTHGFRVVRRPPWRRRSGARVWQAALRGPLAWLGVVAWHDGRVVRPTTYASADGTWRYGAPGEVTAPFGALDAAALTLAQGGRWVLSRVEFLFCRLLLRSRFGSAFTTSVKTYWPGL